MALSCALDADCAATASNVAAPANAGLALHRPVHRIAVLRALMLGDVLCATPALRALRRAYPQAHIDFIGLPGTRELVQRLPYIDGFIDFPGYPGLPEVPCEVSAVPGFLAQVQALHLDLAVQLHGSGRIVNSLVSLLGARQTAGFFDDMAWVPPQDAALYTRWPQAGHEIHRLLAVTRQLGAPDCGTGLTFPVEPGDHTALLQRWPALSAGRPLACVHAGSQLPSRRWPLARFAAIGDALVEAGHRVVLTGSAGEAALVDAVQRLMTQTALNLAGQTTLWTLGALLSRAELLVSNDTSLSHLAAALGLRSVIISSGADAERWSPLDVQRHRVLWQPMACRPCSHAICPVDNACAQAISVDAVWAAVRQVRQRPDTRAV